MTERVDIRYWRFDVKIVWKNRGDPDWYVSFYNETRVDRFSWDNIPFSKDSIKEGHKNACAGLIGAYIGAWRARYVDLAAQAESMVILCAAKLSREDYLDATLR